MREEHKNDALNKGFDIEGALRELAENSNNYTTLSRVNSLFEHPFAIRYLQLLQSNTAEDAFEYIFIAILENILPLQFEVLLRRLSHPYASYVLIHENGFYSYIEDDTATLNQKITNELEIYYEEGVVDYFMDRGIKIPYIMKEAFYNNLDLYNKLGQFFVIATDKNFNASAYKELVQSNEDTWILGYLNTIWDFQNNYNDRINQLKYRLKILHLFPYSLTNFCQVFTSEIPFLEQATQTTFLTEKQRLLQEIEYGINLYYTENINDKSEAKLTDRELLLYSIKHYNLDAEYIEEKESINPRDALLYSIIHPHQLAQTQPIERPQKAIQRGLLLNAINNKSYALSPLEPELIMRSVISDIRHFDPYRLIHKNIPELQPALYEEDSFNIKLNPELFSKVKRQKMYKSMWQKILNGILVENNEEFDDLLSFITSFNDNDFLDFHKILMENANKRNYENFSILIHNAIQLYENPIIEEYTDTSEEEKTWHEDEFDEEKYYDKTVNEVTKRVALQKAKAANYTYSFIYGNPIPKKLEQDFLKYYNFLLYLTYNTERFFSYALEKIFPLLNDEQQLRLNSLKKELHREGAYFSDKRVRQILKAINPKTKLPKEKLQLHIFTLEYLLSRLSQIIPEASEIDLSTYLIDEYIDIDLLYADINHKLQITPSENHYEFHSNMTQIEQLLSLISLSKENFMDEDDLDIKKIIFVRYFYDINKQILIFKEALKLTSELQPEYLPLYDIAQEDIISKELLLEAINILTDLKGLNFKKAPHMRLFTFALILMSEKLGIETKYSLENCDQENLFIVSSNLCILFYKHIYGSLENYIGINTIIEDIENDNISPQTFLDAMPYFPSVFGLTEKSLERIDYFKTQDSYRDFLNEKAIPILQQLKKKHKNLRKENPDLYYAMQNIISGQNSFVKRFKQDAIFRNDLMDILPNKPITNFYNISLFEDIKINAFNALIDNELIHPTNLNTLLGMSNEHSTKFFHTLEKSPNPVISILNFTDLGASSLTSIRNIDIRELLPLNSSIFEENDPLEHTLPRGNSMNILYGLLYKSTSSLHNVDLNEYLYDFLKITKADTTIFKIIGSIRKPIPSNADCLWGIISHMQQQRNKLVEDFVENLTYISNNIAALLQNLKTKPIIDLIKMMISGAKFALFNIKYFIFESNLLEQDNCKKVIHSFIEQIKRLSITIKDEQILLELEEQLNKIIPLYDDMMEELSYIMFTPQKLPYHYFIHRISSYYTTAQKTDFLPVIDYIEENPYEHFKHIEDGEELWEEIKTYIVNLTFALSEPTKNQLDFIEKYNKTSHSDVLFHFGFYKDIMEQYEKIYEKIGLLLAISSLKDNNFKVTHKLLQYPLIQDIVMINPIKNLYLLSALSLENTNLLVVIAENWQRENHIEWNLDIYNLGALFEVYKWEKDDERLGIFLP